jgi:hypothetical protein
MKLSLISWEKALRTLGYKVNWTVVWSKLARRVSRQRKRASAQQQQFQFATLEPRKLLAGVRATFDHVQFHVNENETFEASVVFSNELDADETYSLVVNQGDGSASQTFTGITPTLDESDDGFDDESWSAAEIEFPFEFQYGDDGVFEANASLIDSEGDVVDTRIIDVTVRDVVAEIIAIEGLGQSFSGESYTFNNGELTRNPLHEGEEFSLSITVQETSQEDSFAATLDLGDGSDPISLGVTSIDDGNIGRQITFESTQPLHYADDGLFGAVLTLTDDDGIETTYQIDVEVDDVAPTISLITSAVTVNEGETIALQASASDVADDHVGQWLIDWGDGTTDIHTGNIASATHAWERQGTYTIEVRATNEDLTTDPTTINVDVLNSDGFVYATVPYGINFDVAGVYVVQTASQWEQTIDLDFYGIEVENIEFGTVLVDGTPDPNVVIERKEDTDEFVLNWTTPPSSGIYEFVVSAFDATNTSAATTAEFVVGLTTDILAFNERIAEYSEQLGNQVASITDGIGGIGAALILGSLESGNSFVGSDDDSSDGSSSGDSDSGASGSDGGTGLDGGFSGGLRTGATATSNPFSSPTAVTSSYTVDANTLASSGPTATINGPSSTDYGNETVTGGNEDPTGSDNPEDGEFAGPEGNSVSDFNVGQSAPPSAVEAPYSDAFTPTSPTKAAETFGSYNGPSGDDPFGGTSTGSDDGSSDEDGSDDGDSDDGSGESSDNASDDDFIVLAGIDIFDSYTSEAENAYSGGAWDNYTFGGINSTTPTFTVSSEELDDNLNLIFVERTEIASSLENAAFAEILDRHLFYNNSAFDSVSDSDAIALDRLALLEGQQASSANVSSYDKGINGIIVDVSHLAENITIDDFEFRTGNSNTPDSWGSLAANATVTVLAGQGVGGSNRIKIEFPDGAITNEWLQVRMLANGNTNLRQDDIFYFGNSVGDTLTESSNVVVDSRDASEIENNFTLSNDDIFADRDASTVDDKFDINRDGLVDDLDKNISLNNLSDIGAGFVSLLNLENVASARGTSLGVFGGQREVFTTTVSFDILIGSDAELGQLQAANSLDGFENRSIVGVSSTSEFYFQNDGTGSSSAGGTYGVEFSDDYSLYGIASVDDSQGNDDSSGEGYATNEYGLRDGEQFSRRSENMIGNSGSRYEFVNRNGAGDLIGRIANSSWSASTSSSSGSEFAWSNEVSDDDKEENQGKEKFSNQSQEKSSRTISISIEPGTGDSETVVSWSRSGSYSFDNSWGSGSSSTTPVFSDSTNPDDGGSDDEDGSDDDNSGDDDGTDDDSGAGTSTTTGSVSSSGSQSGAAAGSGGYSMGFTSRTAPNLYFSSISYQGNDNGNGTASESGSANRNLVTSIFDGEDTTTITTTSEATANGSGTSSGDRKQGTNLTRNGTSSSDATTSGEVSRKSGLTNLSGDGDIGVNSGSEAHVPFDYGYASGSSTLVGGASGDSKLAGPAESKLQVKFDNGGGTGIHTNSGGIQSKSDGDTTLTTGEGGYGSNSFTDDDGNFVTITKDGGNSQTVSADGKATSNNNGSTTGNATFSKVDGGHRADSINHTSSGSGSAGVPKATIKTTSGSNDYYKVEIEYANGNTYSSETTTNGNGTVDSGGGSNATASGSSGGNRDSQSSTSDGTSGSNTRSGGGGTSQVTTEVKSKKISQRSDTIAGPAGWGYLLRHTQVPITGTLVHTDIYESTNTTEVKNTTSGSSSSDSTSESSSSVRKVGADPAGPGVAAFSDSEDSYTINEGELIQQMRGSSEANSNSSYGLGYNTPNASSSWTRTVSQTGGIGGQTLDFFASSEKTTGSMSNFTFSDESKVSVNYGLDGVRVTQGGFVETSYTTAASKTNPNTIEEKHDYQMDEGTSLWGKKINPNSLKTTYSNTSTSRTDFNDLGNRYFFGDDLTITSEPTGSETTTMSDVGNESKVHIVKHYQDADYTLQYPESNQAKLISKKVEWEDNRKQALRLASNWDLTNSSEITPGNGQFQEKITTSGHRSRIGSYKTKGDHDNKVDTQFTDEKREVRQNGNYSSSTNFFGKVTPSGSVTKTWVEGEDEPTVSGTADASTEGDGHVTANSYQFASTEVWPDDGEHVFNTSSRSFNANEYFEVGIGAWGSMASNSGSNGQSGGGSQDSYTAAEYPNAKSLVNRYGIIGYRVGTIDQPATQHDAVATAISNPDWFDHTSDFFAGFADNASFGLTYAGRSGANYLTGSQNLTNYNGVAYSAGGWAAAAAEVPGIAGAVKAVGKGAIKRGSAVYAQHLARNAGDDVAGMVARQAAGSCSFWKRVMKGTMCFAAGTKVHLSSLPDSAQSNESSKFDSFAGSTTQLKATSVQTQQNLLVPIEDVPLGATVDAQNPDGTGFDAPRGVASDWQRIELVMHRSDGAILEAELLRHRSETELLEVGQWYELATDEEELSGWAQIVAIDDDVQLGDGEGNLVVSRFKTIANKEVVRVRLENGEEIVGTTGHRVWCINENQFKPLISFEIGNTVNTLDGVVVVQNIFIGQQAHCVFNLEIEGQHVFRIGNTGLLVHNVNGEGCEQAAESAQSTLYHYTDEFSLEAILSSKRLNASTKAANPKDVRYGNGQYFSDILPGSKTPAQLSRSFLNHPFAGDKFTHYLEIDVSQLKILQGRSGVFVNPSDVPLNITDLIVSFGKA